MDVLDAGVFVATHEARVPRGTKMALWGPLQAKELGLEGWEVQDAGETGFVLHQAARLPVGRSTASLIFVRRLEKAFLTVTLAGYPTDAPAAQRRLDLQSAVSAAEVFLTRLAHEPVRFTLKAEVALVDNSEGARVVDTPAAARTLGGGKRKGGATADGDGPGGIDVVGAPKRTEIWEA